LRKNKKKTEKLVLMKNKKKITRVEKEESSYANGNT